MARRLRLRLPLRLPLPLPLPLQLPLLLLLLLLLLPFALRAQTDAGLFPPRPEPAVYVHDYSGWLSAEQKSQLEYKLRRYWDSTSTQVVVMIRPDLGDYDKATYAIELGNRWGVGQRGRNNGVIMLIKSEPPDRGIFIATGYGAEGGLTDLTAGMIIRTVMAPYFREQRYYEGIDAGIDGITAALAGEFKREPGSDAVSDEAALLIIGLVFLFFILLFIFIARRVKKGMIYTNSGPVSRRTVWGPTIFGGGGGWSSGGGWGGGGGGGGFGGGSFGGGSFGGGGAGGDW